MVLWMMTLLSVNVLVLRVLNRANIWVLSWIIKLSFSPNTEILCMRLFC